MPLKTNSKKWSQTSFYSLRPIAMHCMYTYTHSNPFLNFSATPGTQIFRPKVRISQRKSCQLGESGAQMEKVREKKMGESLVALSV